MDYQTKAKFLILDFISRRLEKTDTHIRVGWEDVYIVWFAKTLQNWKALVSTTLPDGMYYEVTYNGDKKETYIDSYKKFENICIPDRTELPHSRVCGISPHEHGVACSMQCPTCGGQLTHDDFNNLNK